ncbi:MAG: hypothetical protein OHK0013_48890 [Sandaracinaceae bacterium]
MEDLHRAAYRITGLARPRRRFVRGLAQDDFVRLVEVRGGPLLAWMLRSGFTQEEIGRIQEPYFHIDDDSPTRARDLEIEKRRVRGVLLSVAAQLERDTDASLEVAVDRLLAHRAVTGEGA